MLMILMKKSSICNTMKAEIPKLLIKNKKKLAIFVIFEPLCYLPHGS